jgi:hypothetical protein
MSTIATLVELTYDPPRDHVGQELRTDAYRRYLRNANGGSVEVGDRWTEIVSDGCGATTEVTLTVTTVHDGSELGAETSFDFTPTTQE